MSLRDNIKSVAMGLAMLFGILLAWGRDNWLRLWYGGKERP